MEDVKDAYRRLKALLDASGEPMPRNQAKTDGISLRRSLDCAVIDMVHFLRAEEKNKNTIRSSESSKKDHMHSRARASRKRPTFKLQFEIQSALSGTFKFAATKYF